MIIIDQKVVPEGKRIVLGNWPFLVEFSLYLGYPGLTMLRRYILLIILFSLPVLLYSQGFIDAAAEFGGGQGSGGGPFQTLLIPAGGKQEGMGTAFTAMSSDTGFLDANPAGSSFIRNSGLSFFHNNWVADTNVDSLAFTNRGDRLGYGLGMKLLYLPFVGYDEEGQTTGSFGAGYYSETILTLNTAYTFLKSYYFGGVSAGANIKGAYRRVPEQIAPDQSSFALMVDLGIQTQFNLLKFYSSRDKNFSLGVSLKNLGRELVEDPDPLPTVLSFGFAYSPLAPLVIAADVNLPLGSDGGTREDLHSAIGMDLGVLPFLSLQGGVVLKPGALRVTLGSTLDFESFSMILNYTIDPLTQFGSPDRFSLGLGLNLGDQKRGERQEKAQELYLAGMEAYAKGNREEALRLWQEALDLGEYYTPAQGMIEFVEAELGLEKSLQG